MDANTQDTSMSLDGRYLAKDFDGAIRILLERKEQFKSGVFSYNLGTIYAKKADWPLARYHLEKAYREGFYSPRVFNNLRYVEQQLGISGRKHNDSLVEKLAFSWSEHPNVFWLLIPVVVTIVLLFFTRFIKKIRSFYLISILVFFTLPWAISLGVKRYFSSAIVFREASLYDAPSEIYAPRRNINGGEKILVMKNKNGWNEIIFPSEYSGWIKNTEIGLF